MNFNRRDFLKGVTLATAAGVSPRLAAEGTTLMAPSMEKGLSRPGKLQTVEHDVDICVVGGGMGGLLTAISAARHGAKVALMHDRPVLGGNASSEIKMWICGAGTRVRNLQETGIMEEIALDNMYRNPSRNWSIWDALLYEKREFIDRLIGFVDIGSGGGGFSLKDKVDAVDFEQRKVLETHKPDIPSDPTAKVPDPGQTGEEDEEENLSKIIERLNSLYGFKGDAKVLTKSIGQIRAMCEANEKLARTAKVSTLSQYKLPFFQAGQDAMSDCLDQNEAFFTLLLNNEDAMKTVLEAIVRQVYEAQRGRASEPVVLHEVGEALRYREYLPYYTLSAACGRFGAERLVEEPLGWVRIAGRLTKNENLYVVRASGHSMEPRIKDGDYCVFEYREGAKPEDNAIVLAEHADVIDDETRGAYSIKKFVTQKGKVILKPLNRGFSDIRIDSPDGYRIVGVFRENYQVETEGSN